MRIDPALRKIEKSKIRDMVTKLSRNRISTSVLREYDVSLFKWLSDFPVVYLPPETVDELRVKPITGRDIWAFEHRYCFTHMDDEGYYWTEPGHALIEERDTYLDGTTRMSEVPRYLSIYEDAFRLKNRILGVNDELLWLKELPYEDDAHWLALIASPDDSVLARGEADEAPQAIVLAVLNFMLEHPQLVQAVQITD